MMYKDPDKQREANAERQRRYKAKHKGVTSEGVTDKALPSKVIPCNDPLKEYKEMHPGLPSSVPSPKRGKDEGYARHKRGYCLPNGTMPEAIQ